MKPETININARYYLAPSEVPKADETAFDVIDRALEYNHRPAVVFSNGTEKECREWVERNCDECHLLSEGPWHLHIGEDYVRIDSANGINDVLLETMGVSEADAWCMATSWKLLALLEQYHAAMPTKESGALIAEAKGWVIQ